MGRSSPKQQSHKSQEDRFTETARALGADEDEAAFKEKLAVIARQKPGASTDAQKAVPQKRHATGKCAPAKRRTD